MQKEIKIVDKEKGIVQVTTPDERFYCEVKSLIQKDSKEKVEEVVWKPSNTYVVASYPKGLEYMRWLAKMGWDEAQAIKESAGDRGTIVHHGIEFLLNNGEIGIDQKLPDREGQEREMTADEWYCVITFNQWHEEIGSPKPILVEQTFMCKELGIGTTLDILFEGGFLVDIKTSKSIWMSHRLQMTGIKRACEENGHTVTKMGLIQVGYMANKIKHYKFTEVEENIELYKATKLIFENDHGKAKPLQREYPLSITLTEPKAEEETAEEAVTSKPKGKK